jgi:hypothetical protein
VLEETRDFSSTNWTTVNTQPTVVGTNATVTLPTHPGTKFYRLRLQ